MLRCVKRILYRAVKFFFQAINRTAMSPFARFASRLAPRPQLQAGFDQPLKLGARRARARLNRHALIDRGQEGGEPFGVGIGRSEEHTSELQSLMRISYAVFCLKKTTTHISSKQLAQTDNP